MIEVFLLFFLFAVVVGEKYLRWRREQMLAGRAIQPKQVREAMDTAARFEAMDAVATGPLEWWDGEKWVESDKPIVYEAPLTAGQMDELDKYAHMEELAECEEMREIGLKQLEWYANWKKAA